MNNIRSLVPKNQPTTDLVVTFVLGLILISKTGYSLGWDDSDYMRMIMCSVNSLNDVNLQNLIHCQAGLYKAPVFLNLFVLPTLLLTKVFDSFHLSNQNTINILCVILTLFCFILAQRISRYLENNLAKITFALLLFLFSREFNYLFMTDLFLALLTTYIALKFVSLYKLRNFDVDLPKQQLILFSFLIVCALGTKFSAAPLILFILILGLGYSLKSNPSTHMYRLVSYSITPLLLFFFCLVTIWTTAWNAGLQMFIGTQSEYYSTWFGHGLAKTFNQIKEFYTIPILIILSMIAIMLTKKKSRAHYLELTLQLSPFAVGFVLYLISKTQDPRFLLPIFFPMSIIILTSLRSPDSVNRIVPQNLNQKITSIILTFCITVSAFLHYSSKDLDLKLSLLVYSKLDATGAVCPLTDSPSLNISKLLLVDGLNKSKMKIEARILNIPDFAMNGVSREEALIIVGEKCNFLYAESGTDPKSYKHEYLDSYVSWLNENSTQIELHGVRFFSRN